MRLAVLMGLLLLSGIATADDRPWAAGVPPGEQSLALSLYQAGNDEFVQQHYTEAAAKYREALIHWDHPGVQYNLAVCLIQLGQPVEAFDHLERSLRFGEAALGADKFAEGQEHRKKLLAELAKIDVTCTTPDAQLTLDGQQLPSCPITKMVAPGQHQLVARREGYTNSIKDFSAAAGSTTPFTIELAKQPTGPTGPTGPVGPEHPETPPPSKPSRLGLYVMGAGGAVAVTAIAFDFLSVQPARDKLKESSSAYDTGLSSFKTRRDIDIAMFVAGGVAIAAGAYLQFGRGDHGAVVAPTATTTSAMVTLQLW